MDASPSRAHARQWFYHAIHQREATMRKILPVIATSIVALGARRACAGTASAVELRGRQWRRTLGLAR